MPKHETSDDARFYAECMERIKKRIEVIRDIVDAPATITGRIIVDAELAALQLRKIFEAIILASLCAHRPEYEALRPGGYKKDWNLAEIVGTIEKNIKEDFYPIPIEDDSIINEHEYTEFIDKESGFLTKSQIVEFHGRLHQYLHETNPYKGLDTHDPKIMIKTFKEWTNLTIQLLSSHKLYPRKDFMWIISMQKRPHNNVAVQEWDGMGTVTVPLS